MRVFEGSGHNRYAVEKLLASGGQGRVYQVKNQADGRQYALKWYHTTVATTEQRVRLQRLVSQGPPRIAVDGVECIWPIEIVGDPQHAGYGHVMPLVDTTRFVFLNRIISGKVKQPDLRTLARLSYLVCVALDAIHAAGLAYCDLHLQNVAFDPRQGQVIVWDTDNIVVNNSDMDVLGVWESMAPEVALGQAKPNADSDLYSMAVLLYHLWMWEHPMDGVKTFAVYCWDIPAKQEYYARNPVFAFHPGDPSNAAAGEKMLELSVQRWEKLCPPVLKDAFIQSFTEGVRKPDKRIRLADWRRLFLALEANTYTCPTCTASNLVDSKRRHVTCFNCATPLVRDLVLSNRRPSNRAQLVVHQGALLRSHHLGLADTVADAETIIGEIIAHPKNPRASLLWNRTNQTWRYRTPQGQFVIEPGQARALVPNAQLTIGQSTIVVESLRERT